MVAVDGISKGEEECAQVKTIALLPLSPQAFFITCIDLPEAKEKDGSRKIAVQFHEEILIC